MYDKESEFEKDLIGYLVTKCGWDPHAQGVEKVLKYPTERDLINNWAEILFRNNNTKDRLNGVPLSNNEINQLLDKIKQDKTPYKINLSINGKSFSIIRDLDSKDINHRGKEVSLKIYDRNEIQGGFSTYQIAEQPKFNSNNNMLPVRRGDFMLLINGMPLFHVELKKSGIGVNQACNQIKKYAHEGIFTGFFSLVQIFVAMTPEETIYFANPGPEKEFNENFFFSWEDDNNDVVGDWKKIAESLLSIPMAHQMIGFYTVADRGTEELIVMRSYQYFAANKISDKVAKTKKYWGEKNLKGGYIWHTTGSGKTLTSFKSAQLISNSDGADKVVFLMDRIELGTQSLDDYRAFSISDDDVKGTLSTKDLWNKLKSDSQNDTLIVTSIQKMSLIKSENMLTQKELDKVSSKRIVFIIDECHRSVYGDMLATIKETFPFALFFGFTGTPIFEENMKNGNYTDSIFGDELDRYTIADGIRDKNVLGFDTTLVSTFKESEIRKVIALKHANAKDETEALKDKAKRKVYYHYMNDVPMDEIEEEIPDSQYNWNEVSPSSDKHHRAVVNNILEKWNRLSVNRMFSALLATSNITEAINYYRLFKELDKELKLNITAIFDPSLDNEESTIFKEDALVEIIGDYNSKFGTKFNLTTSNLFKKDLCLRLAHAKHYKWIDSNQSERIDLVIVVNQLLTGYDSKWLNTLYIDKDLKNEMVIQAISRTNRLFGPDKPFGSIIIYRRPNLSQKRMEDAVNSYSGGRPYGVFKDKLPENLKNINKKYSEIKTIFVNEGISDISSVPANIPACKKFVKEFNIMNSYIKAARIQGFTWEQKEYKFDKETIFLDIDERTYLTLLQRYKELYGQGIKGVNDEEDSPFEIQTYITEISTDRIDDEYMNSKFKKFIKDLSSGNSKQAEKVKTELHNTFAILPKRQQKYAEQILRDIETGVLDVNPYPNKTLMDYIIEYMKKAEDDEIHKFAENMGLDEEHFRKVLPLINKNNPNQNGYLDDLKKQILSDKYKKSAAYEYITKMEGHDIPYSMLAIKIDEYLRTFIREH